MKNLLKLLLLSTSLMMGVASAYSFGGNINAASLYTKAQLSQTFDSCPNQFPNSNPSSVISAFNDAWQPTRLCSDGFAVLYSKKTKTPLVSVENLNAAIIADAKGEERTDVFFPDPRLKQSDSAQLSDYKGSGFDRGHQAPAGDAANQHAMAQTFSLSNMIPQNSENNRKVWSKIEGDTRKYIERANGDVYVYTGPLFAGNKVATIGSSQVWVPTHIFKVVYTPADHRAWAFILTNTADAQVTKPMPYADFVKATGLRLIDGM